MKNTVGANMSISMGIINSIPPSDRKEIYELCALVCINWSSRASINSAPSNLKSISKGILNRERVKESGLKKAEESLLKLKKFGIKF